MQVLEDFTQVKDIKKQSNGTKVINWTPVFKLQTSRYQIKRASEHKDYRSPMDWGEKIQSNLVKSV